MDRKLVRIIMAIYVPGFFIQLGLALTDAFNPLYYRDLGAGLALVGIITAAGGLGNVLFDLPSGWLAGKIREKTFLLISVSVQFLAVLLKGMARNPRDVLILNLIFGMATAAWGIGRLAYLRRRLPPEIRGRSLSFMGGIMRVTRIISPVLGGFLIKYLGFRMIYYIQAGFTFLALVTTLFLIEKGDPPSPEGSAPGDVLKETFRRNGINILVALIGITGLQLLRISRNLLFPLWADHLGVSVEVIGSLTSAGGLIETAMVIPAGILMDRYGRKPSVVPCTLGLGLSLMLLPLSRGTGGLILVMVLMSLTNGIGSGVNMTISSDLAPRRAASEFLGIWRFITDSSQIVGPSLAGAAAGLFSLGLAPVAAGALGVGAGLLLLFGLSETGKLRHSGEE